ncbi:MAG: glycosyltransferase [Candidatus Saccharibacteria bacterium]|nr:glycosyltransferase [Rhodoferax sp.]
MKIAVLMSVYGKHAVGGAERSAEKSAVDLSGQGHEVSLVSLCAEDDRAPQFNLPEGLTHHPVALAQLYDPYGLSGPIKPLRRTAVSKALWHTIDIYNPVMGGRLKALWQEQKPDLVITHTLQGFSVAAWQAARQCGSALIHVIHDHALMCPGTAMTRGSTVCEKPCGKCKLYGRARQLFSIAPDALVAPSAAVLERHRDMGWFCDVADQRVIENAMPADWKVVSTPRAVPTGQRLRFGFLGRLDQSKGVDTLLEAACLLIPGTFQITLAGPGDLRPLQTFIAARGLTGAVRLDGVVQANEFLDGIDVLVTPSRAQETFCNVVMEAGCLGIPSIVSNRGALPERVNFGEAGWIFPAGDSRLLAKAMQFCIDDRQDVALRGAVALQSRFRYAPARHAATWASVCADALAYHRARR